MSDSTKTILELITENGITKAKLERECGFSNGTIGNWEKGRNNPSYGAIVKISKYFGVTTDYLLGRTEKNPMDITREEAKEIVRQTKNRDVIIINEFGSDGDNKSYEISKEDWEEIKELQRIIKQRVRQRKEKE